MWLAGRLVLLRGARGSDLWGCRFGYGCGLMWGGGGRGRWFLGGLGYGRVVVVGSPGN